MRGLTYAKAGVSIAAGDESVRAHLKRGCWPAPPIFDLIRKTGRISQAELDRTFNSGLGMILVVARQKADSIVAALKKMGERSFIVGEIRGGAKGATIGV
jgi:phosphoribosylformylglycinamidine cyclo-ligase